MRSVEVSALSRRGVALAITAVMALLAACSSTPPPSKDAKPTEPAPVIKAPPAEGAAVPAPQAQAPATVPAPQVAAGATAVAPPKPVPRAPLAEVDPGVLRSYEGALQSLKAGRIAEAQTVLSTLAMTSPQLGGPSANLGLIYRKAGKLAEALAAFDSAVAANPDQPVFHNQRGITLREMGRFAESRVAYEKAVSLQPDYADAILNLGVLLDLYLGEPQAALAQFERYLELNPAGDAAVSKWVAELKNRRPEPAAKKEAT